MRLPSYESPLGARSLRSSRLLEIWAADGTVWRTVRQTHAHHRDTSAYHTQASQHN